MKASTIKKLVSALSPPKNQCKPILNCIRVTGDAWHVTLESTDLEFFARAKVSGCCKRVGVVSAVKLIKVLGAVKPRETELESHDDGLHVVQAKTNTCIPWEPGIDDSEMPCLPELDTPDPAVTCLDAIEYREALKRVAVSMSSDPARYQLCGINHDFFAPGLKLTATSGKTLSHETLDYRAVGHPPCRSRSSSH
jgi:DNA polymerase III sliding clamp (beta) subunit (PCNA family)